jgi:ribosomal protein L11 methyltransferase
VDVGPEARVEQDDAMMVVVASTDAELPQARALLSQFGFPNVEVASPGATRRILRVAVPDPAEAARVVAQLRESGQLAVMRPTAEVQLEAWRRHTLPLTFGDRLTVCLAWSEHNRWNHSDPVELDPGGGFGSGGHPSTALLLDELAARVSGGERVLDVGCGSGVLGLCALRLGASSAVGIDIEPQAIEATRRNAAANGLEERMEAASTLLQDVSGDFDVVVANVGRAALVQLAAELAKRVAPSGWLGVSGFSPPQSSLVTGLLRPLRMVGSRTIDEWSSLVLAHGAPDT